MTGLPKSRPRQSSCVSFAVNRWTGAASAGARWTANPCIWIATIADIPTGTGASGGELDVLASPEPDEQGKAMSVMPSTADVQRGDLFVSS